MMPLQVSPGAYSTAGKPSYQQDRHLIHHGANWSLYAVADGHGHPDTGHIVAQHCIERLPKVVETGLQEGNDGLKKGVALLDKSSIALTTSRKVYAGSTLCFVVHCEGELVVGNVGDSRAILVSRDGVRGLSEDHVCGKKEERERIEKAGGWVIGGLLNGYISMSRAIGDDDLKAHRNITPFVWNGQKVRGGFGDELFTGEADITRWNVGVEDVAVVIASDGVWGKLKNEDVAAIVRTEMKKGKSGTEIAKAIVKKALGKGSRDNITAVVSVLSGRERHVQKASPQSSSSGTTASWGDVHKESPRDVGGLRFGRKNVGKLGGKEGDKQGRFRFLRPRQVSSFV